MHFSPIWPNDQYSDSTQFSANIEQKTLNSKQSFGYFVKILLFFILLVYKLDFSYICNAKIINHEKTYRLLRVCERE